MKTFFKHINLLLISTLLLSSWLFNQVMVVYPLDGTVTKLHKVAVTIAGKPGTPATLFINDQEYAHAEVRGDGLYDFLNVEVPDGPVELKLTSTTDTGVTITSKRMLHVLGPPNILSGDLDEIILPADGFASQQVQFEIQDDWGYRLDHIKIAAVSLTNGWIEETDVDTISTGHQLSVSNGTLSLTVQAPDQPGSGTLEISMNGHYHQLPVLFKSPAEPFILVGMMNGTLSAEDDSDARLNNLADMDPLDDQGEIYSDGNMAVNGRTAFYAAGTLGDEYHVTASYDSDRDRENQFMEDFDLDSQYPIYGDGSTLEYDAQSQSKFYARVEKDQSFTVLGDFNTDFNTTEFTAYNRTFNGLYTDLNIENHHLAAFLSKADHGLVLDRIMGEGISGYYYLSSQDVVRYSEQVSIEIRDKYHSDEVLETTRLIRNSDYDIDYINGTIMFKQPVPAIDEDSNPVYIIISYEQQHGEAENYVGGLRYEGRVRENVDIGGSLIFEEQDVRNYILYGIDTRIPLNDMLAVKAEFASSQALDEFAQDQDGNAWKTELSFRPTTNLQLDGYYRVVDSSFVNSSQSSNGSELGTEKYGISGQYGNQSWGQLISEFYQEVKGSDTSDEETRQVYVIDYQNQINSKSRFNLSYENSQIESINSQNQSEQKNTELVKGSLTYDFSDAFDGSVEYVHNLSNSDNAKPNSVLLGLGYDINEKIRVFFKHRLVDHSDKSNETIFGIESRVNENIQLDGKYEIGGSLGENRSRASIGLKNKWSPREDLTFNLAYENTATFDDFQTPIPEHDAVSMSFEFLPEAPYKLTGKFENRRDETTLKRLYGLGTAVRIIPGLSTIAKIDHARTDYTDEVDEYTVRGRYQFGLAYRPETSDDWNLVGKLEYVTDQNTHVDPEIRYDRLIMAMNAFYQPTRQLTVASRVAFRHILDEAGGLFSDENATTYFYVRPAYDLTDRWSTALDLRTIHLDETGEIKFGTALELNYLLKKDIQVGIGYTFMKYDDPDFSNLDQLLNRFYLTFHLNFSESIFDLR